MKHLVIACCLALAWCASGARGEVVDRVLATVDTEVILQSEVMDEIGPMLAALPKTSQSVYEREAEQLMREALTRAVDLKILYRQAMLVGKGIPEEHREEWDKRIDRAVEERLAEIRKSFEGSDETFHDWLESSGLVMAEFRERFKKQFIAINMANEKRGDFLNGVVISESEVAQYYEDNRDEFVRPERLRIRRIFLKAGQDKPEREAVKTRLLELRAEAAAGADFAELARTQSEGPDAEAGGLIGNWTQRGDLVEALESAAFALKTGELSDVIETEWGFHLLLVEERREAGTTPLEEAWPRIEEALRNQQAQDRYDKWIADLRKRSRVRIFI